jgi:G:T/U-mismatch repair DNA glycosylase
MTFTKEVHPEWHYPVPGMRALILGTYPPHARRYDYEFFYPNKQNRFWKLLADIAGVPLTENAGAAAVAQRQALMKRLRVGVQNMGRVIERKGTSSLDRDIRIIEFHDILSLLKKSKNLKAILVTGYSGPSSTYRSFLRYLDENKIKHTRPEKVSPGETFTVDIGRPILCILGNSTSMAACRSVKYDDLIKQFKMALGK